MTSREREADRKAQRPPLDEHALEMRARAVFDDSVTRLDARTRSRLTQARNAALDELRRPQMRWIRWLWAPAGGLAAAVIVAAFIATRPGTDAFGPNGLPLEDLDVVASAEELELLQEVEFYAWLAQQTPEPAGGGSG